MNDIDTFKDIPGYKAILKSILKSQIQLLIEQLSNQTGEETIILTASVSDGSLSHLGSSTGKGFLEGRDEIKSQFLGYCLKTHHRAKTQENKSPYQRTSPRPRSPPQTGPPKRPKAHPVSLIRHQSDFAIQPPQTQLPSGIVHIPESKVRSISEGANIVIKQDPDDPAVTLGYGDTDQDSSLPASLQYPHTQTSGNHDNNSEPSDLISHNTNTDNSSNPGASNIKVEPITENEMELEITGVEYGEPGNESWAQDQSGYAAEGDASSSFDQGTGDQSGYMLQCLSDVSHSSRESSLEKTSVIDDGLNIPTDAQNILPSDVINEEILPSTSSPSSTADKKRYKCPSCPYSTNSSGNAHRHKKTIHLKMKEKCPKCEKTFASSYTLQAHVMGFHDNHKFLCEICSQMFNNRHTLRRHCVKMHSDGGKHICNLCGKRFIEKDSYLGHLNKHTGLKSYKCKFCEKSFQYKSGVTRHLPICKIRAERKEDETAVVQKHECDICGVSFGAKPYLVSHLEGKHGSKLHTCQCGQSFSWKNSFARHKKSCKFNLFSD